MEETEKIILGQFKKLPRNLQETLLSPVLREKLHTIAQKHDLNQVQERALETEVVLVMMGLESALSLPENMERALATPQEESADLMRDTESMILAPIRELLSYFLENETKEDALVPPHSETLQKETYRNASPSIDNAREREKTRPNDFDPYREPIE